MLPCYFFIASKIKLFHMLNRNLYFFLGKWPVELLWPFFVSVEGCSSSFQYLSVSHLVLHLTPLVNMSRTMIPNTSDDGNPGLLPEFIGNAEQFQNIRNTSVSIYKQPDVFHQLMCYLVIKSVAQITNNQELRIQKACFHFFPKFDISEILRLIF